MKQRSLPVVGIIAVMILSPLYPSVTATPTPGGTWPPNHEPEAFLPRVNVVHVADDNTDTEYNFLTAIPMSIFHYQGTLFKSLLTTDHTWDKPTGYVIDDWCTYLSGWGGASHINFIGDVPDNVTTAIMNQYGVGPDHASVINGTPIVIANKIAAHDWKRSDCVVIVPYYNPVISESDIESISNGASLASLYNAPLLLTEPTEISSETLSEIARLHATEAVLVEIGDSISQSVSNQLTNAGVTIDHDCLTEQDVVALVRSLTEASTLCAIRQNWQNLPASMEAACYGGYVLFLPYTIEQLSRQTFSSLPTTAFSQLKTLHQLDLPTEYLSGEEAIARQFYGWLDTVDGNDTENLENVLTFCTQPYYDSQNGFDVTFERAISGDPSRLTDAGAIPGRMPLHYLQNIALANRDMTYRATIFANPRPKHVTLAMNAYEVEHSLNGWLDDWGHNHIVNEIFGWPYQGWSADNGYFPWQDIHDNMPDLSPVLPPGPGDGPDCDPGQFASFLASYEVNFHSGAYPGPGSHPAQPDVPNCGFVSDLNNGSVFLYFSCHGGGTVIAVRHTDNGIAQDSDDMVAWGGQYWPSTDGIVYDGSGGGYYNQGNLDVDVTNVQGAMTAYNACDMAKGAMNEILLLHGGAASFGSYTSVSFDGSGWWWNLFVHCVSHLNFTIGEA
ncbi:MAG TPA: cell wall-binding repeat-containing protein, partial [Candidatus Thermoplasmatota archaeon]|nr:cell wall-binding repeat-containing protein [Candidatus Thermoplasmatota archaeon]